VTGVPSGCRAGKNWIFRDAMVSSARLFIFLFYDIPYYFYPEYPGRHPQERVVPVTSLTQRAAERIERDHRAGKKSRCPCPTPIHFLWSKKPRFLLRIFHRKQRRFQPHQKWGSGRGSFSFAEQGRSSHATNEFATTIRTGW
jgi:hypothetical protein